MTESSKQGLSTRTIHGHSFKDAHGSPHLPVYDTTTFAFKSTADLLDVVDGRKPGSLYTRYGLNPSIFAIEETLASLEGAEMAWSFCSGMAAETALFLTHGREGIVCIGDAYGARVAVDNTFASPVNQRPLELGADFVVHSATKYLGGHSDLTAGVLMGSKELLMPVWGWRKNLGSMITPATASLLARSLRTLVVRVRQQNESAQRIAEAMDRHPKVSRVYFPGLPEFPGHALAKDQMYGFGGMLTIEVAGNGEDATRVADRLKLFALAPSLGGAESLVTQPCTTTHHGLTTEERARRGISDAMLRLSVGLEDAEDLIADLEQALG